jgi:hypothetical protein
MPESALVVSGFGGVLGLLVGSFLNVVIYRLPKMLEHQWTGGMRRDVREKGGRDLDIQSGPTAFALPAVRPSDLVVREHPAAQLCVPTGKVLRMPLTHWPALPGGRTGHGRSILRMFLALGRNTHGSCMVRFLLGIAGPGTHRLGYDLAAR